MSEFGSESFAPGEDGGQASEAAREQARQKFAGAQQAMQQLRKDEKKSKKRDDGVAQVIIQFLTDEQRTHLATLISRLVAINCPSIFILAVLSLINEQCSTVVQEYLKETQGKAPEASDMLSVLPETGALDAKSNARFLEWIGRMERVLSTDPQGILAALLIEEKSIDGTVLQLTSFVLEEFFESLGTKAQFEELQPVAAGILQSVFQPYVQEHLQRRLAEKPTEKEEE